ncbi:NUC153 and WD40 repeat-containing nucleolar rRNA processing-related protein [Mycena olivaceomarginata]|nr:NUC153 and WD40 repeat-containing nucleolar rRNA processing-related protein [Mycena olivaceomarginata]
MAVETDSVKVYTVNGATAASSSSLPDWLTRKRAAKSKGKRAVREHVEGTIELIQGFEFPEASNRIKTTRDGQFAIATGTYKPQMRVWDLGQLTLKFERHSDAENVDFVMLSDDWTKAGSTTAPASRASAARLRTTSPPATRSSPPAGNEIYRLNLDQGRFMTPLALQDDTHDILGVNTVDINPAHQLLAFGLEGPASAQVQFWDLRSRTSVGVLRLPRSRLGAGVDAALSVTAISSRADGLSYAIGTSTGHTLLYDIRAAQPFALKDQGYGLPVKNVAWIEGGSRMAGDGMVLSADRKVIKIWDRNSPSTNFAAITPAADLNHVHHVPASGLLMTANEGIQMATYYIPQLGPAPRWASFLENITEEMEDQTTRSVYEDYKFVERSELAALGLAHLVGTPALKPYMHGYFLALRLYDAARIIANPFAYAEHREKVVRARMEKMAETRIRARKDGAAARGHGARALRPRAGAAGAAEGDAEMPDAAEAEGAPRPSLLTDPRFAQVFADPAFTVDETSREFALMNPSAAAQRKAGGDVRRKTMVEEEEEESDNGSEDDSGSDSDDAGALNKFDPRVRPGQKNARAQEAYSRTREQNRRANEGKFVPMRPAATGANGTRLADRDASFGQRRGGGATSGGGNPTPNRKPPRLVAGGWNRNRARVVEVFGAGMEKGYAGEDLNLSEQDRKGRTQRRKGIRSGSKNVFRSMNG